MRHGELQGSGEQALTRGDMIITPHTHLDGRFTLAEHAAIQARGARALYGNVDLSAGEVAPASTGAKADRKKRLKNGDVDPNLDPIL